MTMHSVVLSFKIMYTDIDFFSSCDFYIHVHCGNLCTAQQDYQLQAKGVYTHCNIYLPQEGCDKRMYNGFDKAAEVLKINSDTNLHRIVKYQTNYF